jgi:hypothetical protein
MFTKTLLAALIIVSAALASAANAGPAKQSSTVTQQEHSWMDRASQNIDGGGY